MGQITEFSSKPQYEITNLLKQTNKKYISVAIRNMTMPILNKTDYNKFKSTLLSMY